MAKILLVEDDVELAQLVSEALNNAHHLTDVVHNAADARAYAQAVTYDVVILDWQLPDGTGIDFLLDFRRQQGQSAVLMLTARSDTPDKVAGLDAGADDYLTKPFDLVELLSRVRALLRRPPTPPNRTLKVRDIELNSVQHTVTLNGEELKLYPKEFSLLELFMLHPKQVFSPDDLLDRVWPTDSEASVETVRQTILRLRQKVEQEGTPALILTVRGFGYRMDP